MTQFTQRLGFNLANTLARDTEITADLFERAILPIEKAVAHFKDFALAIAENAERLPHLFFQELTCRGFGWAGRFVVRDKVAVLAAFFLPNRLVEAQRLLTDAQNFADFLRGAPQFALQTGFQRDALL